MELDYEVLWLKPKGEQQILSVPSTSLGRFQVLTSRSHLVQRSGLHYGNTHIGQEGLPMQIQPAQQARALVLKNRIDKISADILAEDGKPRDLDNRPGTVTISSGQGDALVFPASAPYKEEIVSARVTDSSSRVDSKQYYDSSYGRSAESGYVMEKEVKDGVTVYRQRYFDPMGTNNTKSEVSFNAAGDVVGFKHKEFAATWGEALKDVFTSPAGLALVGVAGLLGGCPGSLGYALAGSAWPGLVTAGAAAAGMAYYKTRPW